MDDNRTQATSAYQSGYKYKSGCEHKRDSSLLGNSPSEKKLISDTITGIRLFPGAAALQKNNRPVNMRTEATRKRVAHLGFVVNMRPETGLKKSRGGEKKESSRHPGHLDPSIAYPQIADSEYFTRRFSWLLFLRVASPFANYWRAVLGTEWRIRLIFFLPALMEIWRRCYQSNAKVVFSLLAFLSINLGGFNENLQF